MAASPGGHAAFIGGGGEERGLDPTVNRPIGKKNGLGSPISRSPGAGAEEDACTAWHFTFSLSFGEMG